MTLFERSPGVSDLSRLSPNVPSAAAVWTSPRTQVWMWTSLTAASVAGPWPRPFVVTWRWSRITEILWGQHQQLPATTGLSPPWTSPRSKVHAITWITQLHMSRKTTAFSQQPLLLNACVSSEWQWRWDWVAPQGLVPCWAPQLEVEPDPQHRRRPEEHGQHLLPELSSAVSHLHGSVHQLHADTGALQNLWVFAPRCYFSHAVI